MSTKMIDGVWKIDIADRDCQKYYGWSYYNSDNGDLIGAVIDGHYVSASKNPTINDAIIPTHIDQYVDVINAI